MVNGESAIAGAVLNPTVCGGHHARGSPSNRNSLILFILSKMLFLAAPTTRAPSEIEHARNWRSRRVWFHDTVAPRVPAIGSTVEPSLVS